MSKEEDWVEDKEVEEFYQTVGQHHWDFGGREQDLLLQEQQRGIAKENR